ncbi:translation initiation factor IF-3 [Patescibacteria group bacterium]
MRRKQKTFWLINEAIRAPELRVITAEGKQIGVMGKDEALQKAKDDGLDLVEIATSAKPPVAKLVEFGKFKYQEEKKARREAKKTKAGELKEVRFSPFIAENDYNTRFEKVKEFLEEKNKVKVVVVFMGRQMNSKRFGYDLIDRILKDLGDKVITDMQPKFLGRHLVTIVSPVFKSNAKTKDKKIDNKKV